MSWKDELSDDDDGLDEGSESDLSGFSVPSFSTPLSSSSGVVAGGGSCPCPDFELTHRGDFNELPLLTAAICDAINPLFQAPLYADCWRIIDGNCRVLLRLRNECRRVVADRMKGLAKRVIRRVGSAARRCRFDDERATRVVNMSWDGLQQKFGKA